MKERVLYGTGTLCLRATNGLRGFGLLWWLDVQRPRVCSDTRHLHKGQLLVQSDRWYSSITKLRSGPCMSCARV